MTRLAVAKEKFEFQCSQCKTVHHLAGYAIAQLAAGNNLIFTCNHKLPNGQRCEKQKKLNSKRFKQGWNV